MRLKTEEFIEESWRWLIRQDNNFKSKEEFTEWTVETQPEVDAHAVNNYLTKIFLRRDFRSFQRIPPIKKWHV